MNHDDHLQAAVEVDHLTICWGGPGDLSFKVFPDSADSERLARRLVGFVALLYERPELIRCAAGNHGEAAA